MPTDGTPTVLTFVCTYNVDIHNIIWGQANSCIYMYMYIYLSAKGRELGVHIHASLGDLHVNI